MSLSIYLVSGKWKGVIKRRRLGINGAVWLDRTLAWSACKSLRFCGKSVYDYLNVIPKIEETNVGLPTSYAKSLVLSAKIMLQLSLNVEWIQEDDLLFLKYCYSKRDKCYHAISRDS